MWFPQTTTRYSGIGVRGESLLLQEHGFSLGYVVILQQVALATRNFAKGLSDFNAFS